jgi:Fe-S-cluster containining protein
VTMVCRAGCGACCIAPSIKEPFYGMPEGKPAGHPCVHLDEDFACGLFDDPRRPAVCAGFMAEESICGFDRTDALARLTLLEIESQPIRS